MTIDSRCPEDSLDSLCYYLRYGTVGTTRNMLKNPDDPHDWYLRLHLVSAATITIGPTPRLSFNVQHSAAVGCLRHLLHNGWFFLEDFTVSLIQYNCDSPDVLEEQHSAQAYGVADSHIVAPHLIIDVGTYPRWRACRSTRSTRTIQRDRNCVLERIRRTKRKRKGI